MDEDSASRTALALTALAERVGNIVFVSDYLYSDAARYDDDETERYRRALALCDRTLAAVCDVVSVDEETRAWREAAGRGLTALALRADTVTRLFCGLPLRLKG